MALLIIVQGSFLLLFTYLLISASRSAATRSRFIPPSPSTPYYASPRSRVCSIPFTFDEDEGEFYYLDWMIFIN
jgi:hypothetical protein